MTHAHTLAYIYFNDTLHHSCGGGDDGGGGHHTRVVCLCATRPVLIGLAAVARVVAVDHVDAGALLRKYDVGLNTPNSYVLARDGTRQN